MPGWAAAEAAQGHQEDQHVHRHICGVLHPLCCNKVSGYLNVAPAAVAYLKYISATVELAVICFVLKKPAAFSANIF